jgi:Tol biopolymer transport system component
MTIAAGTRLEHYEVSALLGAGGMGEVYRATDTKLKREVALKILPKQFASDPSRLARFEREAQVLASLNHPNIGAIYGVEHADGIRFLVLELVEGPTIADRLASGPIPVPEALRIATQIAEATEAAHEKGVIHRDLKPGNVKLTPDGKVKVLDFGLAKALGDPEPPVDPANSPTMTMQETRAGIVLGTAAYMSPEQAQGKTADKRADIWAFGVIVYEILTGKRLFEGKTVSHIIVHVMEQEPDWSVLPPLPPGVKELLQRCLQKDAAQRLRDIGDIRVLLQSAITQPVAVRPAAPKQARSRRYLWPAAAIAIFAAATGGYLYLRPKAPPPNPVRFEIAQPGNASLLGVLAISPDGQKLAFLATGADQRTLVWVRSLETLESRPLEETAGINGMAFWSPDSRFLAFEADLKLKKIDVSGGPAQTLCELPTGLPLLGGFWTADNRVVFGMVPNLMQVPAGGGTATKLAGYEGSGFPAALPDGRHFLYMRFGNSQVASPLGVYLGSLDNKPGPESSKPLLADSSWVVYAASPDPDIGYLLFVRGMSQGNFNGTLMAQPISTRRLELMGDAVPLTEQVSAAGFSASATGVLVYGSGPIPMTGGNPPGQVQGQFTWSDRAGKVLSTVGEPGLYRTFALSPDDTRLAYERTDPQSRNTDIWILELKSGKANRFTFAPQPDFTPLWSPDGKWILFSSPRPEFNWYRKASNGDGEEEVLARPGDPGRAPTSWSRDGRFVLFNETVRPSDIGAIDVGNGPQAGKAKILPLVTTPGNDVLPRFSPDEHWVSYASDENESGRYEDYVRPFDPGTGTPAAGGKRQISKGGGAEGGALWRRVDGKELFYVAPDGYLMSVAVNTNPEFRVEDPKRLFKVPPGTLYYDVSSDGQRFLIVVPTGAAGGGSAPPYKVILNWTSTLRR